MLCVLLLVSVCFTLTCSIISTGVTSAFLPVGGFQVLAVVDSFQLVTVTVSVFVYCRPDAIDVISCTASACYFVLRVCMTLLFADFAVDVCVPSVRTVPVIYVCRESRTLWDISHGSVTTDLR